MYEVLEVSRDATKDEIKASYRRLAKKYHPDLNGGDLESQEIFKEITAAYEVLGDEEKRQRYDRYGTTDFSGQGVTMDFEDIFGDIFDIFTGGVGFRGARRSTASHGEDRRVDIHLDLIDTLEDTEKTISYKRVVTCDYCDGSGAKHSDAIRTCGNCHGSGRVRTVRQTLFGTMQQESICPECHGKGKVVTDPCDRCDGHGRRVKEEERSITLKRGLKDGNILKLGPYGDEGTGGGSNGELYAVIHVNPHPGYSIEGNDLIYSYEISFPEAALGAEKVFETLDSKETIVIPEGTQHGDVIKISKKGLYQYNSHSRGDLFLICNVKTPTKLTKRQRELLMEFEGDDESTQPPPLRGLWAKIKTKWYTLIRSWKA